jgi:excisionase family DNA binding protein
VSGRHRAPRHCDDTDQLGRLAAYRAAHPEVVIGSAEFGTWEARIPEPNGETVVVRYTLRELLDRLGDLAEPRLLTPGEVAALFRVDPKTVAKWERDGKLPARKTAGGHRRYRQADVDALLAGPPEKRGT